MGRKKLSAVSNTAGKLKRLIKVKKPLSDLNASHVKASYGLICIKMKRTFGQLHQDENKSYKGKKRMKTEL